MSAVVHYLSRRYCFTAECIRTEDGNYEATLARRPPGLVERTEQRPPKTATLELDEYFSSTSLSGALSACKQRILRSTERSWARSRRTETTTGSRQPW
jgi:hypothetical protein